jgi:hypothetical protein
MTRATGVANYTGIGQFAEHLRYIMDKGAKVQNLWQDPSDVFHLTLDFGGDHRQASFRLPEHQAALLAQAVDAARISATAVDGEALIRSPLVANALYKSAAWVFASADHPDLAVGAPRSGYRGLNHATIAAMAYLSVVRELGLNGDGPKKVSDLTLALERADPRQQKALQIVLAYVAKASLSKLGDAILAEDLRRLGTDATFAIDRGPVSLSTINVRLGELLQSGATIRGIEKHPDGHRHQFFLDYQDRAIDRRIDFSLNGEDASLLSRALEAGFANAEALNSGLFMDSLLNFVAAFSQLPRTLT